jgi:hypothetical protein
MMMMMIFHMEALSESLTELTAVAFLLFGKLSGE